MKYTLVITPAAQQDISDALTYYLNISHSLAERFLDAIEEAYNKLEKHPQHYSFFGNSRILRSLVCSTFPYSLIFETREDRVYVIGLHHQHQHPDNISKRL